MQQDHLSIATEANRQLRSDVTRLELECSAMWHKMEVLQSERGDFAEVIAEMFAKCYASSYLRGDEVAWIIRGRYCK